MEGSRCPTRSDTGRRIVVAVPAIAFAVFIVIEGGLVFALGLAALGLLALHELYRLMGRVRPVRLAGYLTLIALVLAALYGDQFWMVAVVAAALPLHFGLGLLRPRRADVSWAMAATLFGALWIGLALAHAVLLRDLVHGRDLVIDVLIGTFVGDAVAYFAGRAWGSRPLAPLISPNKSLEGAVAGILGGTLAFWLFAVAYQDFFRGRGWDALFIGACVALATPVGDLFESLVKRDLGAKDAGRLFGAHGGVLDRLDAVFLTAVAGYYASLGVGF